MTRKTFDFPTRKTQIIQSRPQGHGRQRVRNAAAAIARLGWARASAELINEAVTQFITLLYTYDKTSRTWPHIDAKTGVITIVTPFSSRNYARWGLRRHESNILRQHILHTIAAASPSDPPLLIYDSYIRRWLLNIGDYNHISQAIAWWQRHEITPAAVARYNQQLKR